jgi:hypothetical protein
LFEILNDSRFNDINKMFIQTENVPTLLCDFILVTLNSLFTLMYLGWTFNDPERIDPTDWKRDWIVIFTYVQMVMIGIFTWVHRVSVSFIPLVLLFASNILGLTYLGWTVADTSEVDPKDWRRRWIILFAWYGWISVTICFIRCVKFNLCV